VTLDDRGVGVGEVDLALRRSQRRVGVRPPAERPAVLHAPGPVALIGGVGAHLGEELFFQAPLGLLDPLRTVPRNRLGVRRALLFKLALGFAQPRPAAFAGAQLLGQLVAARVAVELILGGIDGLGFLEDLARELS
jgi:hypothetical protein